MLINDELKIMHYQKTINLWFEYIFKDSRACDQ